MRILALAIGVALVVLSLQVMSAQSAPQTFKGYLVDVTEREKDWRVTVSGTLSNGTIAVSSLSLQ